MIDICVCRYNESESEYEWLYDLLESDQKYYLHFYNKGTEVTHPNKFRSRIRNLALKNVGREAHTFCYHILHEYTNRQTTKFSHLVMFQCNPFDRWLTTKEGAIAKIRSVVLTTDNVQPLGHVSTNKNVQEFPNSKNPHHPKLINTKQNYEELFKGFCPNPVVFSPGVNYVLSTQNLRKEIRSEAFWKSLLVKLDTETHPEFAWSIERLWLYILDRNIVMKDEYYQ